MPNYVKLTKIREYEEEIDPEDEGSHSLKSFNLEHLMIEDEGKNTMSLESFKRYIDEMMDK